MIQKNNDYPEGYNTPIFMATSSKILDSGWREVYDLHSEFGDKRRYDTFNWLSSSIENGQSCVINAITNGETERKRAERFINNSHVEVSEVIERCCVPIDHSSFEGEEILNIIDQTVITYADAVGRIVRGEEVLGVVGNGLHYGQNCVAGLAVRREDFKVLGLSSLLFFSTDKEATRVRDRIGPDIRPLKYRETEKWVLAARQAGIRTSQAKRLIHVIDREGDNLNFMAQLFPNEEVLEEKKRSSDTHLVIRAKVNRSVQVTTGNKQVGAIFDLLKTAEVAGCYWVDVTHDERMSFSADYSKGQRRRIVKRKVKRKGRKALLEIRYISCRLDGQSFLKNKSGIKKEQLKELLNKSDILNKEFTYIEVREVNNQGEYIVCEDENSDQAISWLILTSLPVDTLMDALDVVNIYKQRFPLIEQLFRGLKADGFNVEAAQHKSLKALQIITAMAMKASALVMKMIGARNKDSGYNIDDDFSKKEIKVLELCSIKYEGKTKVQSNPHPPNQLSWAVWIIARMGGWKPENKKRHPGPKTLQRGLSKFYNTYEGVAMANGWLEDVSQP